MMKMTHTQNAMNNPNMFGINNRRLQDFTNEKQKISRSIARLDNFKKHFRYMQDDIN